MRMTRTFVLLLSLFTMSSFSLSAQCGIEFEGQGPVFNPEDEFTIRICYQDESLGFPQYLKADWDANDNGDPTDVGEIEVTGGTILSVVPLGTGNTFDASYCLDVEISVGYGISMTINVNAIGINPVCSASGQQGYIVLPVEFTRLEADLTAEGVEIEWQTAREINNESFTIQRSLDGVTFTNLDVVKGAGNSNDYNDYKYFDKEFLLNPEYLTVQPEEMYYRLEQTDYDGLKSFSEIMVIRTEDVKSLKNAIVSVVPESNGLSVQFSEGLKYKHFLQVFDLQGNLIIEQSVPSNTNGIDIESNLLNRYNGILILHVSGPELNETMKFFK